LEISDTSAVVIPQLTGDIHQVAKTISPKMGAYHRISFLTANISNFGHVSWK